MFPVEIRTDRLSLRRATREEMPSLECYDYCREGAEGIEEVTEYAPWDPHASPKESRDYLARCEEMWDDGEAAAYVVRPREGEEEAGEFAGMAGLNFQWDRDTAVFGTWLRKTFWGRGYSGERARALLTLAFDRLNFGLVAIGVAADNRKSRRTVEKYVEDAGGRFEGVIRRGLALSDDDVRDEARYSVSQEEWREAGGAGDSVRFVESLK